MAQPIENNIEQIINLSPNEIHDFVELTAKAANTLDISLRNFHYDMGIAGNESYEQTWRAQTQLVHDNMANLFGIQDIMDPSTRPTELTPEQTVLLNAVENSVQFDHHTYLVKSHLTDTITNAQQELAQLHPELKHEPMTIKQPDGSYNVPAVINAIEEQTVGNRSYQTVMNALCKTLEEPTMSEICSQYSVERDFRDHQVKRFLTDEYAKNKAYLNTYSHYSPPQPIPYVAYHTFPQESFLRFSEKIECCFDDPYIGTDLWEDKTVPTHYVKSISDEDAIKLDAIFALSQALPEHGWDISRSDSDTLGHRGDSRGAPIYDPFYDRKTWQDAKEQIQKGLELMNANILQPDKVQQITPKQLEKHSPSWYALVQNKKGETYIHAQPGIEGAPTDIYFKNTYGSHEFNNSEIVSLLKGEEISIPLRSGTGTVKLGFGNINGHEYFGIQRTDLSKERRLPTAPEETAEQQIDSKQAE